MKLEGPWKSSYAEVVDFSLNLYRPKPDADIADAIREMVSLCKTHRVNLSGYFNNILISSNWTSSSVILIEEWERRNKERVEGQIRTLRTSASLKARFLWDVLVGLSLVQTDLEKKLTALLEEYIKEQTGIIVQRSLRES